MQHIDFPKDARKEKSRLSPAEALPILEEALTLTEESDIPRRNRMILETFAQLDPAQLRFVARVDANGATPIATFEKNECGGAYAGGAVLDHQKAEEGKILLVGSHVCCDSTVKRDKFTVGASLISHGEKNICAGAKKVDISHFRSNCGSYPHAMIGDFQIDEEKGKAVIGGLTIKEGDEITIDPASGNVYKGVLPILPPDENTQKLAHMIPCLRQLLASSMGEENNVRPKNVNVQISNFEEFEKFGYFANEYTMGAMETMKDTMKDTMDITKIMEIMEMSKITVGLYRTDTRCEGKFIGQDASFFEELGNGIVPESLKDWKPDTIRGKTYRVLDIRKIFRNPEIRENVPGWVLKGFEDGDDHVPGTRLFKLRETLCKQQLVRTMSLSASEGEHHIIFPEITNAAEAKRLKEVLEEAKEEAPAELGRVLASGKDMREEVIENRRNNLATLAKDLRFGIMAEDVRIKDEIKEIAPLCRYISVGLGGLTESHTCVPRDEYECGQASPYDVLSDEVAEIMEDIATNAKTANPDVIVNVCGDSLKDPASLNRVFEMEHVDGVSVYSTPASYFSAQIAAFSFEARKLLGEPIILAKPRAYGAYGLGPAIPVSDGAKTEEEYTV